MALSETSKNNGTRSSSTRDNCVVAQGLPYEVWQIVFSHLYTPDLAHASQVCKAWNDLVLALDGSRWRELYQQSSEWKSPFWPIYPEARPQSWKQALKERVLASRFWHQGNLHIDPSQCFGGFWRSRGNHLNRKTILVGKDVPCNTLKRALCLANDYDRILIKPGIYDEQFEMSSKIPLELIGQGELGGVILVMCVEQTSLAGRLCNLVIRAPWFTSYVLKVLSGYVQLDNCIIEDGLVLIQNPATCHFQFCTFRHANVILQHVNVSLIENSEFSQCDLAAISVEGFPKEETNWAHGYLDNISAVTKQSLQNKIHCASNSRSSLSLNSKSTTSHEENDVFFHRPQKDPNTFVVNDNCSVSASTVLHNVNDWLTNAALYGSQMTLTLQDPTSEGHQSGHVKLKDEDLVQLEPHSCNSKTRVSGLSEAYSKLPISDLVDKSRQSEKMDSEHKDTNNFETLAQSELESASACSKTDSCSKLTRDKAPKPTQHQKLDNSMRKKKNGDKIHRTLRLAATDNVEGIDNEDTSLVRGISELQLVSSNENDFGQDGLEGRSVLSPPPVSSSDASNTHSGTTTVQIHSTQSQTNALIPTEVISCSGTTSVQIHSMPNAFSNQSDQLSPSPCDSTSNGAKDYCATTSAPIHSSTNVTSHKTSEQPGAASEQTEDSVYPGTSSYVSVSLPQNNKDNHLDKTANGPNNFDRVPESMSQYRGNHLYHVDNGEISILKTPDEGKRSVNNAQPERNHSAAVGNNQHKENLLENLQQQNGRHPMNDLHLPAEEFVLDDLSSDGDSSDLDSSSSSSNSDFSQSESSISDQELLLHMSHPQHRTLQLRRKESQPVEGQENSKVKPKSDTESQKHETLDALWEDFDTVRAMEEVQGVVIRNCSMDNGKGGIMVSCQGHAKVVGCHIANMGYGIRCVQNSRALVLKNEIRFCRTSGIFMRLAASGVIAGNNIHSNMEAGIDVRKNADPIIQCNRIHHGERFGVAVLCGGQGQIRNNNIFANAEAGIYILYRGNPLVSENRLEKNQAAGISVNEHGLGMIRDNIISGNLWAGVYVRHGGDPYVQNNVICNGVADGVVIGERGRGTIAKNTITGNAGCGVWIMEGDCPLLHGNNISNNGDSGIALVTKVATVQSSQGQRSAGMAHADLYIDEDRQDRKAHYSQVKVVHNTVCHNSGHGISVESGKDVTVGSNSIYWNSQSGVYINHPDSVTVFNNHITCNQGTGVTTGRQGQTKIVSNGIFDNKEEAVLCQNEASVIENDIHTSQSDHAISMMGTNEIKVQKNRIYSTKEVILLEKCIVGNISGNELYSDLEMPLLMTSAKVKAADNKTVKVESGETPYWPRKSTDTKSRPYLTDPEDPPIHTPTRYVRSVARVTVLDDGNCQGVSRTCAII